MKRFGKIVAILCVLGCLFALFACEPVDNGNQNENITVGILVSAEGLDKSFSVTGSFGTVEDVMVALAAENEEFTYVASNSEYGLFVSAVCGYEVSGNEFWGLYTDTIREDNRGLLNVFEEYTLEYLGKTYYSCAQGVSGQGVGDGETVLFTVGSF